MNRIKLYKVTIGDIRKKRKKMVRNSILVKTLTDYFLVADRLENQKYMEYLKNILNKVI